MKTQGEQKKRNAIQTTNFLDIFVNLFKTLQDLFLEMSCHKNTINFYLIKILNIF